MKNLASWLIVLFAFMFWGFRIVAILMMQMGKEFMIVPMDINIEIILSFLAFICILLLIKRKLIGSLAYVLIYGAYFGTDVYHNVMLLVEGGTLSLNAYTSLFFSFIGIILPLASLFDILLDKNRKAHPKDKKTDWFYKNEQYDRKLDERADKNNYRTL